MQNFMGWGEPAQKYIKEAPEGVSLREYVHQEHESGKSWRAIAQELEAKIPGYKFSQTSVKAATRRFRREGAKMRVGGSHSGETSPVVLAAANSEAADGVVPIAAVEAFIEFVDRDALPEEMSLKALWEAFLEGYKKACSRFRK